MLGRSIGRFFRAVIRVISLGFIKMAEPIERSPEMVGLQYEEIIVKKAKAAKQVKDAIGGLMAQQETAKQKLQTVTREIEELEDEKAGAQALAEKRAGGMRAAGKTDEDIMTDTEVMQYQAAFTDASSTIAEKQHRAADLEGQVKQMQATIDDYILQVQTMAREVEKLRSERHEAVADMAASQRFDEINEALAGISTSGVENELANLRRRRQEAKGKAKASARVAGVDMSVQRQKLRAAARQSVHSTEFLQGIGLGQKEKPSAEPPAAAKEAAKASDQEDHLPEG